MHPSPGPHLAQPRNPARRPIGTLRLTDRVPYIATWTAELTAQPEVTVRRSRLAYLNERPYDRDSNGTLWRRIPHMPGKGKPLFAKVHFLRQRQAMQALLCQVCGQPARKGDTGDGVLWLLGEDPDDRSTWPTDMVTGQPPVCLSCAWLSVSACPHLRKQYTAVRVHRYALAGVHGVLYRPSYPNPVPYDVGGLDFGDRRMPWLQASQLRMRLIEFTQVDLETEYTANCP